MSSKFMMAGLGLIVASTGWASDLCLFPAAGRDLADDWWWVNTVGYSEDGQPCVHSAESALFVSLSRSGTDPHANTGTLTEPYLYLWVMAEAPPGYGFAELWATYSGDVSIEAMEPLNGAQVGYYGPPDPPSLWYFRPLPFDLDISFPVARLTVSTAVAVEDESWGRLKSLYR